MTSEADRRLALAEDARLRFSALYERPASWDIDGPQPALLELAGGFLSGRVLDAGCGSGENALALAARGLDVWGIDIVDSAIGRARAKAAARGLPAARFLVGDALGLGELGMTFDAVLDCGLFHAFTDEERALYRLGLEAVLPPGGRLALLGFSDRQAPETGGCPGPRRLGAHEFAAAFPTWRVLAVEPARFLTRIHRGGAHAWRVRLERV